MKKLLTILVLAVAAFVVWNILREKQSMPKPTDQARLPAEPDLASPKRLGHPPKSPRVAGAVEGIGIELTNIVISNYGVDGTVVLRTQAIPTGIPPIQLLTPEEIEAAREQWRQELKEKGQHKEMFAKEKDWKEKSKSITTGMTLQEVIAVMGLPTQVQTALPTDNETAELVPVPTNALSHVKIIDMAFVHYSPDGKPPEMESGMGESRLPFDHLFLQFDAQEILTFMAWGKEGLSGSTSRIVRQRTGQPEKVEDAVSLDPTAIEPVTPPPK